jgi:hypothetical protein
VENISKGEAMRYLAELPWLPQAMVANQELEWRQIDDRTVEVATRFQEGRLEVFLHFDAKGDIVVSTADARPRDVGGRAVDTPFRGDFRDYAVLGGVRAPTTARGELGAAGGPLHLLPRTDNRTHPGQLIPSEFAHSWLRVTRRVFQC